MRSGGPEHYRPFVQAYGPYIYHRVFTILRSSHDAEDVTQEVLLQIYHSLPEYRMGNLKAWISRIAVNRAIDYKRRRARRPEQLTGDLSEGAHSVNESRYCVNAATLFADTRGDGMLSSSPAPAAEVLAIKRADKLRVHERIDQLPEGYREVVAAFYIEEKSYDQIAAETGLERKSVESKLYRARSWMKRNWRKEDFE